MGGSEFHRAEIIEYDPDTDKYTPNPLVKAHDILPALNTNTIIDCLATLNNIIPGDSRVLLAFDGSVVGTDGSAINDQDIAIWDPADDTIKLHISMSGGLPGPSGSSAVTIKSWQIS